MQIGILKESGQENRVAILPEHLKDFEKLKVKVLIEQGAGINSFQQDQQYVEVGATIKKRNEILNESDILLQINPPDPKEINSLGKDKIWLGVLNPLSEKELVLSAKNAGITSFSLDAIPRSTRGQAMDILSSMATIAGYKAVLDAARYLPTFFPMFMSAAGTIKPAKVLILGAGVAGLQAIAIARKLGAMVEAFDVRSAVKEEVQSLGGKFIEVEGATEDKTAGGYAVEQSEEFKQKQSQMIQDHAIKSNVVICTAQIPGRKAPILIKKETVEQMPNGAVIIDLAASTGGNCELTRNNEIYTHHAVTIVGESNYASSMPIDASRMFGRNVINFLKLLVNENGELSLNFEDDIIKGACITHQNQIINERVKTLIEQ